MTVTQLDGRVALNNGIMIPQLGLGVWRAADGEETYNAVRWALETGYRSIDTASLYANEESVGRGFRDSGLPRDEVFITTKVWNPDQGYDKTMASFDKSLKLLGLDYVDSFLVHYPVPGKFLDTWRALEELYEQKLIRTIGVSNFHEHHLDELLANANVKPSLNQIELHPYLSQKELMAFNAKHGILTEAWAPMAKGRVLNEPIVTAIAQKYNKTAAQVVLRWELQQGIIIIPKSVHKDRIIENKDIFDFALTGEEMAGIDSLNCNGRIGTHPDEMDYST